MKTIQEVLNDALEFYRRNYLTICDGEYDIQYPDGHECEFELSPLAENAVRIDIYKPDSPGVEWARGRHIGTLEFYWKPNVLAKVASFVAYYGNERTVFKYKNKWSNALEYGLGIRNLDGSYRTDWYGYFDKLLAKVVESKKYDDYEEVEDESN